jgi:tripartite-type tricarboxylate transporter receptor subunit TctC
MMCESVRTRSRRSDPERQPRTPDAIIRRLYDFIKDTMAQPEVQKPIRDAGNEVWVTSPEAFARFIAEETKLWSAVLKGLSVTQH